MKQVKIEMNHLKIIVPFYNVDKWILYNIRSIKKQNCSCDLVRRKPRAQETGLPWGEAFVHCPKRNNSPSSCGASRRLQTAAGEQGIQAPPGDSRTPEQEEGENKSLKKRNYRRRKKRKWTLMMTETLIKMI